MDKTARKFLSFSVLLTIFFIAIILLFTYIYRKSAVNIYNGILLVIIILAIITTVVITALTTIVLCAYKKKHVSRVFILPVKLGLRLFNPLILLISTLLKTDVDVLRSFYIDVNNILVESDIKKYKPEQVLLLLPHCLQNSECKHKVTGNINNCKMCGKCCVGDILKITREFGINTVIVTGGTAARNIVKKNRPRIIISVACERDLASGIMDIKKIPVIGLLNERPNGPCIDTTVDLDVLRARISEILQE